MNQINITKIKREFRESKVTEYYCKNCGKYNLAINQKGESVYYNDCNCGWRTEFKNQRD